MKPSSEVGDPTEAALLSEVERHLVDMWWEVDLRYGRNAGRFFTEDALFDIGGKPLRGRADIDRFYAEREARGPRTTRHIISNMAILLDEGGAHARYVMQIYGADGDPVLPSAPPLLVCDVVDDLTRGADGIWYIASHVLQPLFEGGTLRRPT